MSLGKERFLGHRKFATHVRRSLAGELLKRPRLRGRECRTKAVAP